MSKYVYLRQEGHKRKNDFLISNLIYYHIFIDYGLESISFQNLSVVLEENDEVIVQTFAHLGISNYSMLHNLKLLINKGVLVTSIDDSANTVEKMSWLHSITLIQLTFNRIIAFLSSERLLNKNRTHVFDEEPMLICSHYSSQNKIKLKNKKEVFKIKSDKQSFENNFMLLYFELIKETIKE